ncbi:MAG: NADH-dependent [FeFe] hydrogenase, group A6 [Bacilli bacterium]|nr:NADH-dependent [FeFe] hydrogenase, group A6 [Bacilli bacterium]
MINVKIEGKSYQFEEGLTILEATKKAGFNVPTLCYYKNLVNSASCRVCLVEVKGARTLVTSCNTIINEGMEISINSERAYEARRKSVKLLLSNHINECTSCKANGKCELQSVAKILGIGANDFPGSKTERTIDIVSPTIQRDTGKCILCGRCIEACKKYQGIGILAFQKRGFKTIVGPAENRSFSEVPCMYCGQCVNVCPTGALSVKEEYLNILKAKKEGKFMIAQAAPAVRAALGEEFGLPIGTAVTGKMIASLRKLGFDRVFDVNFGADLTIMEEHTELIERIKNGGKLPMITSCSPGWVRYCEFFYPELIKNLSTCKSPNMMQAAIIKSYFAKKHNLKPEDIYLVSVMPCSAKKYENIRDEMEFNLDCVITTRELAEFIKGSGIDFNNLEDEQWDNDLLGEYSGAGVIFGASGGVMEAALRTAYHTLTGKDYEEVIFPQVRAESGIKEATIEIDGIKLNVAVASSMHYAKPLLEDIKKGTSKYHFIEIMGCPSGCINGGGQPFVKNDPDYINKRRKALYNEDERNKIRFSYKNPDIIKLYEDYLGKPCGEKSHHLLHTKYFKKEKYPDKK